MKYLTVIVSLSFFIGPLAHAYDYVNDGSLNSDPITLQCGGEVFVPSVGCKEMRNNIEQPQTRQERRHGVSASEIVKRKKEYRESCCIRHCVEGNTSWNITCNP